MVCIEFVVEIWYTVSGMKLLKISLISLAISVLLVEPVMAATFNRHAVISDADMTDSTRMSSSAVFTFLRDQGGILGSYRTTDTDGVDKTAAEIIYNAAQRNRLNPQFLLAHIQKESSLVTGNNSSLLDWALGFGVCDSCSKDHPDVVKYKGFAKQVDAAANQFRNGYLADLDRKNSTISGWGVGISKNTLDGITITPQNKATAAIYTYTPWLGYHGGNSNVGGNSLFFDLMERFFPNRTSKILDYPDGTIFQKFTDGSVYKLENGTLRPITSQAALLANYDVSRIILADDDTLNRYPVGADISYPKFIYIQDPRGGVYLIDQNHNRRAITSREQLRTMGVNPEEIIPLSQAAIDSIPEKPPITNAEKYPLGGLLQNSKTGAVMYLDMKTRLHPVWSKDVMENRFKGLSISSESVAALNEYEVGDPVKLADGTLVKIPGRDIIYVIDDGRKRPIQSAEVLEGLGGFANVIETTKPVLKLHDQGKVLKFKSSAKTKKKKKKKNKKK